MSVASSLEVALRVPGNRAEFPFPLQVVSTELFSPVIVAFSAKVHSVRKFYRRNFSLVINKEGHRINMES